MKKRKPKYMGSGIHVHQQFQPKDLVKGDTFCDADFGGMIWNGKKWISDESDKVQVGTVDLTPTWSGILPALLAVLEDGNAEGKKIAKDELKKMAKVADMYVENQK